jgi:hypothetical protein
VTTTPGSTLAQSPLHLVVVWLGACLVLACASRGPRLPARVIDDPVTLPKGMTSVKAFPALEYLHAPRFGSGRSYPVPLELAVAVTPRIELVNFFALRFAIMDDAAGAVASARGPVTIALSAGVSLFDVGIGLRTIDRERIDLVPHGGLLLGKTVHRRVRVEMSAGQRTYIWKDTGRTTSVAALGGGARLQVTDAVAAGAEISVYRWTPTSTPWWYSGNNWESGITPQLFANGRWFHWMTIGAFVGLRLGKVHYPQPRPGPDWTVAQSQLVFADPGYQSVFAGARTAFYF